MPTFSGSGFAGTCKEPSLERVAASYVQFTLIRPNRFGKKRRSKASELLATTDWKVSDVALESGYSPVGVLNQAFKERFGLSPARWRDQLTSSGSRCPQGLRESLKNPLQTQRWFN